MFKVEGFLTGGQHRAVVVAEISREEIVLAGYVAVRPGSRWELSLPGFPTPY